MIAAIVDNIVTELPDDAVVCLVIDDPNDFPLDPGDEFLADLNSERVVPTSKRPETYGTWILPIASLGHPIARIRPDGHVDPFHLRLTRLRSDAEGAISATALESQGTLGRTYDCSSRIVDDEAQAICGLVSRWIS